MATAVDEPHQQADLLNDNFGAVLENPLGHLNEEQLLRDVENFARRMSLTDILPGLRRAALVAQNIVIYDEVSRGTRDGASLPVDLTPKEKLAIRNERDHLFAQSAGVYMTVVTVSIAGILQGWVQSSINGATLFFPPAYDLRDDWITGITNAAPFLFAALVGCALVDPLNRRIGRRGAIFTAAVLIFASSLGSACTSTWVELFVCRIFNGIGMGLKASSTPILASETAVSFWRGSAALCWQLWVAFGIALGFAVNLVANRASPYWSMKLQLGAPLVPALVLMVSLRWCPESPRWHMIQGDPENYRKAYRIFVSLRNTELQAQRDLYLVHKQIELETYASPICDEEIGNSQARNHRSLLQVSSYRSRFGHLFRKNRLRNALFSACIVNLAQQLCGINVLAFYSSKLFTNAANLATTKDGVTRASVDKAFLYSFGFGAINFVFCLPAIRNIDTLGRRTLLLGTLPFMSICLFAAAFCFYIPRESGLHIGFIAFFLFLFSALYSPGLGPMPFTIASESFPLSHREIGVATSVGLNLFFAGLLTVFYPRLNSHLGDTGSLCLFAGFNLLAFLLIFLFLPETKQRSLEELDQVFAVPVKRFTDFQIRQVLPWFIHRYVLFRDVQSPELYQYRVWGTDSHEKDGEPEEQHLESGEMRTDLHRKEGQELVQAQREEIHGTGNPSGGDLPRALDEVSISSSVGTHD